MTTADLLARAHRRFAAHPGVCVVALRFPAGHSGDGVHGASRPIAVRYLDRGADLYVAAGATDREWQHQLGAALARPGGSATVRLRGEMRGITRFEMRSSAAIADRALRAAVERELDRDADGRVGVLITDAAYGRSMRASTLPALRPDAPPGGTAGAVVLLALYAEVNAAWRALTDVRFKLLALVPTISGAGLFGLLGNDDAGGLARAGFALLGFLAILGLWVYELRNSRLYDDLISRGRRIEEELGAEAAVFRGRVRSSWPIQHDVALRLVYGASLAAWFAAMVASLVG